jgi:hypothetical protein
MKITVKKANQDEIRSLRERLQATLTQFETRSAELVRLENHQQKLEKEITDLEAAGDAESDAAATTLAAKRIQLEQVSQKIEETNSRPRDVEVGETLAGEALLRKFGSAAAAATGPSIEAFAMVIAGKIRPWCLDDATAMQMAYAMPASRSLTQTYTRRFGDYAFTTREVRDALARADEILSGELDWSWDANKASSPGSAAKI